MGSTIYEVPLGFDHTYIVKDQGTIMIDGGEPNKGKVFLKRLKEVSIKPEEIQLIAKISQQWHDIWISLYGSRVHKCTCLPIFLGRIILVGQIW